MVKVMVGCVGIDAETMAAVLFSLQISCEEPHVLPATQEEDEAVFFHLSLTAEQHQGMLVAIAEEVRRGRFERSPAFFTLLED